MAASPSLLWPARSAAEVAASVTDPVEIPESDDGQAGEPTPDEAAADQGNTIFREIALPQQQQMSLPPKTEEAEGEEESGEEGQTGRWGASYFGIFYGPSVLEPSLYQPSETKTRDLTRPLLLKNLLTLSYALSERVAISGTGFWSDEPVQGRGFTVRDPYLRLSHNSLIQTDVWSLYGDVRLHFPVTQDSRQADLLTAVQSFQSVSANATDDLRLALWASQRANYFGKRGFGNDLELYFAPNLEYAFSDSLAFTLVYEFGTSHFFGDPAFAFSGDGSDLQPGISWSPSRSLNLNPYLNIPTSHSLNVRSASFGMTLLFQIL